MTGDPTLAQFGHGTMIQNGRPATGRRPLLVVLTEYDENPPISDFHPVAYYEQLAFGDPARPFSTRDPVNPASLQQYFLENSSGRFTFERLGVIGPLRLGKLGQDPGPEARFARIIIEVARRYPDLFAGLDEDGDLRLEFDELCVLSVENFPDGWPANRDNMPVTIQVDVAGITQRVTVQVHWAGVGPRTPFYQIAHETSHNLGTDDLYNSGALGQYNNIALTLMSGYSFTSDDQGSVHLDGWHKLRLGWTEPQVFDLETAGFVDLDDSVTGSAVLWRNDRGASEYFLLERRTPSSTRLYDDGVAGDGVLIWRSTPTLTTHLSAPDLGAGGSGVWGPGTTTPALGWADGTSTGVALTIGNAPDGRLRVSWPGRPDAESHGHRLLCHGGNGATADGRPLDGVFYGVTAEDAHLEWNRYVSNAGATAESLGSWDPNTGNFIGRGWGAMRQLLGCGDGAILGVHDDGDLYWYRYAGDGTGDESGGTGWDPRSGGVIAQGWDRFTTVVVLPKAGDATMIQLFGVAANGDLHWHGYQGDGEPDPTGTVGWHPHSGNRVGNGWQGLDHLVGAGTAILAIRGDELLWYSYHGDGSDDVSGGTGWDARSGTVIGTGWSGVVHLCAGTEDAGGSRGQVLFSVRADGLLRWDRYNGQGESDYSYWSAGSGTAIGHGW